MNAQTRVFADRTEAGVLLGHVLARSAWRGPLLVLGLPRGGVPVAYEAARAIGAPLDVLPVRRISMPGQPEVAIGAVAWGNTVMREHRIGEWRAEQRVPFDKLVERERSEVQRRERIYRAGREPLNLHGKTVILVDDGIATGSTMLAAIQSALQAGAARIVAAAPVASREAAYLVKQQADQIVLLQTPPMLYAVSQWYGQFEPVEDEDVCRLLHDCAARRPCDDETRTNPIH
jgi:putative phosphoribosyl transferase